LTQAGPRSITGVKQDSSPLHPSWTPWYPTARLFRQDIRRDWSTVVARVADSLREDLAGASESLVNEGTISGFPA